MIEAQQSLSFRIAQPSGGQSAKYAKALVEGMRYTYSLSSGDWERRRPRRLLAILKADREVGAPRALPGVFEQVPCVFITSG